MKRILPVHRGLPRTRQTTVYRTGDDGTFQAGVRAARTRLLELVDGGDGTVTDLATGLQWVKNPTLIVPGAVGVHATNQIQVAHGDWANNHAYAKADLCKDTADSTYWVCAVAHTSAAAGTFAADRVANPTYWRLTVWTASAANLTTPATHAWNDAVDRCLALVYAGYDDWRLPNLLELTSLFGGETFGPLAPIVHPAADATYTWSSSIYVGYTVWRINVRLVYSQVSQGAITNLGYVYPVRGGLVEET